MHITIRTGSALRTSCQSCEHLSLTPSIMSYVEGVEACLGTVGGGGVGLGTSPSIFSTFQKRNLVLLRLMFLAFIIFTRAYANLFSGV